MEIVPPNGSLLCGNQHAKAIQMRAGLPTAGNPEMRTHKASGAKRSPLLVYLAPYSLEELGNEAVLDWKRKGKSVVELLELIGRASDRSLDAFKVAFAAINANVTPFDELDDDLGM